MKYLLALKRQAKARLSPEQFQAITPYTSKVFGLLFRNDLRRLAVSLGSDKEGSHFYAQHYQRHFAALKRKKITLLEIGIGGEDNPILGGSSLRMWKSYFPKAQIVGIDIHDKSRHNERRIRTMRGSQADVEFLNRVVAEIGSPDIIIDDGSHRSEHIITSFTTLFPKLKQGGIYVIEDVQTSYWDGHGGDARDLNAPHTTMNFVKRLVDGLNYEEFLIEGYVPSYYDRNIVAMHFYHNLVFIYKGENTEGSTSLGRRFT